jgi:5-methylphenazine-1-carboxylate 1-monooxygenase
MTGTRTAIDVAVIGGGIGGLVTALSLQARGIDCTVFESVEALRPLGVGINLLPHSVRVLAALGLQPALADTAIETAELAFYNRHGQLVWSEPRGLAGGYAFPQFSIHRGELQMILLRAALERLGPTRVLTGHALESFDDDGDAVRLVFADRNAGAPAGRQHVMRARAVIAADGIHSVVRRHFHPDEGPPRFSGRMLWRATTAAAPFLTGRSMVQAGHQDQKFVCYPISAHAAREGRALVNWIAELRVPVGQTPPRQDWSRKVAKSVFAGPFAGWRFPWLDVPALIDAADAVYEYPMVDRDPLPRWTHGRVTLLGDAAHPMYPIGSNGASQAILDAEALAEAIAATPGDLPQALARYEHERLEKVNAVVLANRNRGPEKLLQLADARLGRLDGPLLDAGEIDAVTGGYRRTAGFERDELLAMAARQTLWPPAHSARVIPCRST